MLVVTRVAIVGPTGAGKSSMAEILSGRSGLPHIDLDQLLLGPEWTYVPEDVARRRVTRVVDGPAWLVTGNYAAVRDIVWRHAELIVWLDLPRRTVFRRLLWRTGQRLARREKLAAGNRESLGRFFSRQSILVWAVHSHRPLQAEYERAATMYGDSLHILRLRTASAQRRWLASATAATPAELPMGVEYALACSLEAS